MEDATRKKVDESWKDSVVREKGDTVSPEAAPPQDSSFLYFLSSLAMQAFVSMGEAGESVGAAPPPDLVQARYLIDLLQMLSEKTRGNLSQDEEAAFKNILYELQIKFVEKTKTVK